MATRKIKGSYWVDFSFDGVRHRKRSPQNSKGGAQEYEALLRGRLARGEPIIPIPEPKKEKIIFETFAWKWFDLYVTANNKPSEQLNKRNALRGQLLPFFGQMRIEEISSAKIEEYKALKRKAGNGPKTINNHLGILGKCLRCAVDWGVIEKIPKMTTLKVPPSSFDFLTPQESHLLLEAITEHPWNLMILTALRTGMRLGELIALDWQDIDLERRIIVVRHSRVNGITGSPKNNRIRYIPISSELHNALSSAAKNSGYVFLASHGGPITKDIAAWQLKKYCKRAGLRRIRGWHTLRHSFASQLTTAGVPIRMVQELMGHATIQMTMRYSHLSPSLLTNTIEILDALPHKDSKHFWATGGQPQLKTVTSLPSSESEQHQEKF